MTGLSIVIPMRNEAGNAGPLIDGILAACDGADGLPQIEVIAVNDGSTDGTAAEVLALAARDGRVRLLGHAVSAGQSAAIHSGVLAARGALICTLDGDGQNPPEEIPRLASALIAAAPGIALVAGQRADRKDTQAKRIASKLANGIRSAALDDGTRDTGCGLKAFRREAFLALPYFNHMHRYLPALFTRDGWEILHLDVGHRPRGAGQSNYGNFGRALAGASDLLGVMWLVRRRKTARATEETTLP
ncbi:glycosyltransferase family 2 protein [Roseicyclus sp. F158]|uniref:Glycosyltransferase family 2 protein n=1 Tax=Tropicimonas omnivorans TaxID=3075590 RepID=A0ABU3DC00_9RHOB|nr:glycosyltransferase family 2 protein [Roseicyclus sp. F158]MDT0681228.1 glycosyltransferase family 2 protein [Roseicyclus sp. F158]